MDAVMTVEKWLYKRGLTLEAFARVVAIRPRELARILDRKDVPTPRVAQRIVDFTGGEVTLIELLFPLGRSNPEERHHDQGRDMVITQDVRLELLQIQEESSYVSSGDTGAGHDE